MKKFLLSLSVFLFPAWIYAWTPETLGSITWTEEDGGSVTVTKTYPYQVTFTSSVVFSGGSGSVTGIVEQVVAGTGISVSAATGIVTITATGGAGDMYKADYDTDADDAVDLAEGLSSGNYFNDVKVSSCIYADTAGSGGAADNLGNHIATTTLVMGNYWINSSSSIYCKALYTRGGDGSYALFVSTSSDGTGSFVGVENDGDFVVSGGGANIDDDFVVVNDTVQINGSTGTTYPVEINGIVHIYSSGQTGLYVQGTPSIQIDHSLQSTSDMRLYFVDSGNSAFYVRKGNYASYTTLFGVERNGYSYFISSMSAVGITSTDDIRIEGQKELKLYDSDSSNYVSLKASATVSSNLTWVIPISSGSAAQVLHTDGNGNLYFDDDDVGGAGSGAPAGCYYVVVEATNTLTDERVITCGDALTGTDGGGGSTYTIDFDGGATPAGDLGGTWADPSVDDDSHNHGDSTVADDITLTNITQITNRSHESLTSTGTYTHATIESHISNLWTSTATLESGKIAKTDNFVGDVTGTYDATVVGNDSHNHGDTTITDVAPGKISGGTTDADVVISSMTDNIVYPEKLVQTSTYTVGGLISNGQVQSNARKLVDQYDFAVCITTPVALGTVATLISPFRSYAVTITTISAQVIGGTNVVFMVEQRTIAGIESAGTDIWSGDVTAVVTNWTGGTSSDFTIPADSALVLVITSVSGAVDRLMIKGRFTKD